ncbi:SGNH/GDSL hydrolase family protein [Xanthobacter versatilis]|uniref:SGNH/GDSL hydrolase family protein n=1 Tax=Xanthobacter autotrophicus (strain ATCC BAA-1158 / Py2) TaxID=78245 RepID=UPI003728C0D4
MTQPCARTAAAPVVAPASREADTRSADRARSGRARWRLWLMRALAVGGIVGLCLVLWNRIPLHTRMIWKSYRVALMTGAPVLALGDSITFQAAPSHLCGTKVLNSGIPGDRIDDLLARAPMFSRLATPRQVVVAIGVNDARTGHMDIGTWAAKYRTLLGYFPKSELVLVEVNPVDLGNPHYLPVHDRDFIASQNAAIRVLAGETGARVVTAPAASPTMDGLHPDKTGVVLWQQRLAAVACAG